MNQLEKENARLKKLLAEAELEKAMLKELARGKLLNLKRRCAAKRTMRSDGVVEALRTMFRVSERFACKVVG